MFGIFKSLHPFSFLTLREFGIFKSHRPIHGLAPQSACFCCLFVFGVFIVGVVCFVGWLVGFCFPLVCFFFWGAEGRGASQTGIACPQWVSFVVPRTLNASFCPLSNSLLGGLWRQGCKSQTPVNEAEGLFFFNSGCKSQTPVNEAEGFCNSGCKSQTPVNEAEGFCNSGCKSQTPVNEAKGFCNSGCKSQTPVNEAEGFCNSGCKSQTPVNEAEVSLLLFFFILKQKK